MQAKDHWEQVYASKAVDTVSWYQPHAELSLRLIRGTGVPTSASVIDVGGGASTLVDDLLLNGYTALTVLDVAAAALAAVKGRLGERAGAVHWLVTDITDGSLPIRAYDVWHDRAVFHFLTTPAERRAYVWAALRSLKPGGHIIVATFAADGPTQCSGLPVVRYSADALHAEFGEQFALLQHEEEEHHTPFGTVQKFVYCYCRKAQN